MAFHDFRVKTCFTDFAFALVYDCFCTHITSLTDVREVINLRSLRLCLVLMFLLAALIRRDEINAPGHLLDREYTSAIFARAFYFMSNDQVEDWRRDIAVITMNQQPVLEP